MAFAKKMKWMDFLKGVLHTYEERGNKNDFKLTT